MVQRQAITADPDGFEVSVLIGNRGLFSDLQTDNIFCGSLYRIGSGRFGDGSGASRVHGAGGRHLGAGP